MSKFEEALSVFTQEMTKMGLEYHEATYINIVKYLGPSIYQRDASLVACSDPEELAHIRKSFLIGKLGLEDTPALDKAIANVCEAMGKSNRTKHRATFYYLLASLLGKADVFS